MKELMEYLNGIGAQVKPAAGSSKGKDCPEALRALYDVIGSAELPFGTIYDLDTAIKVSERAPFFPDWFVFGEDHYFSYWLCYKGENEEGFYFTYWDHESGLDIGPPVWEDLLTFLQEAEEDSEGE